MTMTADETPDRTDREIIAALAEAWNEVPSSVSPLGGEVGPRGLVTGWRVESRIGDETSTRYLYLEDDDRTLPEQPGVVRVVDDTGLGRRVWQYPDDPALPALPAIVFPEAAATVLRRLGLDVDAVSVEVVAYRPTKRAVLRVRSALGDVYVKVLPPELVESVHDRHRAWHEAGLPSPPPLAWAPEGLLLLGALSGVPGPTALERHPSPVELAGGIDDLRDRIARIGLGVRARASLGTRLDWYRSRLTRIAPALAPRIDAAVARAEQRRARGGTVDPQVIHGDLHLGQLLIDAEDGRSIVGVVDVDTSGLGDPADDTAALWTHLVVLAEGGSRAAALLADDLATRWVASDAADRVAAVAVALLLGHGLSSHLTPARAVELAERVASADEDPLITGSWSSHVGAGL
jgi:hypothetical protein